MTARSISCWWVLLPICIHGMLQINADHEKLVFNVKKYGAKADGETDDRKVCSAVFFVELGSNYLRKLHPRRETFPH